MVDVRECVCVCWYGVVSQQVSGGSKVVCVQPPLGPFSFRSSPTAVIDSGHRCLLSAPFVSGQKHLTWPVVTKRWWMAGSKVKYSLLRSGGFPLQEPLKALAWFCAFNQVLRTKPFL